MSVPGECRDLLPSDDSEAAIQTATASCSKLSWRRAAATCVGLLLLVGTALRLGAHGHATPPRSGAGSIVALSAAGGDLYNDFFADKDLHTREDDTSLYIGPLPLITEAFEAASEHPPEDLVYNETCKLLSFNGSNGALLLPSLEKSRFKKYLDGPEGKQLVSVKILAGVNSDSFNRGLGVAIEAPLPRDAGRASTYEYNGFGLTEGTNRNVIKFHPDYDYGQLRIEGTGGFPNQNIGFTPEGWTNSGHKLQDLEITLTQRGINTLTIPSPDKSSSWSKTWENKFLDGPRLPAVYAWLDLGGEAGKPLMIGHIYLVLEKGDVEEF